MLRTLWIAVVALAALGALGCASQGAAEAAGESVAATHGPRLLTRRRPPSPSPSAPSELAGWSNRRLAAQLVVCSVPATDPLAGKKFARMGVGGIVILGGGARSSIGGDLAAVLRAAPGRRQALHRQRRGGRAGPAAAGRDLPAAVGPRPGRLERVEDQGDGQGLRRAAAQAARLRGVRAGRRPRRPRPLHEQARPVLLVEARGGRQPRRGVGDGACAPSRVLSTVKHWPGHGWASDTHSGAARVPSLSVLRRVRHGAVRAGLRRRRAAGDGRAPALARGSRGTRRPRVSRASALTYLRGRTGDDDRHHHRLAVHGGDDQGARHQAAGRRRAGAQGRRRPRAVRLRGPGPGDRRRDGGDQVRAAAARAGGGEGAARPRAEAQGRAGAVRRGAGAAVPSVQGGRPEAPAALC